jgi:U32 family peptidase
VGGQEEFVGEVIKCEDGKVFINAHNALRLEDKIRIMQPKGEDLRITIKKMYNEEGEEVESAHGGTGKLVYIKTKKEVEKYSILFKK